MRTLAITTIFVVLNGLGFAYRAVSRRGAAPASAAAAVPHSTPARAQAAPASPPAAAITPAPPPVPVSPAAEEPASPDEPPSVVDDTEDTGPHPAAMTPSEHDGESGRTVRTGSRGKSSRRQGATRGGVSRAQPAPSDDPAAPAPAAAKTERPDAPEDPPRTDDSLLKMEANPYKRGE